MTPAVEAAQAANGSANLYGKVRLNQEENQFTDFERQFIATRDSFYMATVSETGWPYVQHRGGPPGFIRILDDKTLACADFRGNRQYISIGNLAGSRRACLFLMDYPHRHRLKIYVHVEIRSPADDPRLMEILKLPGYKAKVERALVFRLEAYDWNCPQHITPRFTERELEEVLAPLRERLQHLEVENAELRQQLGRPASKED